jgi:aerobic carbon-monoxide dehydrogenase large subunit
LPLHRLEGILEKFGKSQPVKRVEDIRFLNGRGRYIDDVTPDGALFAHFFRAPVAHAEIATLDVDAARAAPGVHAVLTFDDLVAAGMTTDITAVILKNRDGTNAAAPKRPLLAHTRVRHVGEALACIVAETMDQARDAAELIDFDFNELAAHVTPRPGGNTIHAEAPDNLAFDWGIGQQAETQAAFDAAAHHVTLEVEDNRIIVNAIEPRGCYAEWVEGRLHLAHNGQGVWDIKGRLARAFAMDADQVRVTIPDVGGGFGMKALPYPEYFVVPQAARVVGRPVRWIGERTESMLSDNAGRDLVSLAELALDETHKITAYRVNTICNLGAYNSGFAQAIQTELFHKVLTGAYDIENIWLAVRGVYTNTMCVDAYRGAGRPEAIYVLERAIDHAARVLNVDPYDFRRHNFVPADAFPYQAVTGELIDVGDFRKVLARGLAEADQAGFAARKAASAARGKLRGLGLCYYIEAILGDASEDATIEFTQQGRVNLYVGTQSAGQGHETVFAQFLADQSGIAPDLIDVVQGDSDRIARGGGTGGSRSGTSQNNATLVTVATVIRGFGAFLAGELGLAAADVSFDDETFRVAGSNLTPSVMDVAEMARAAGRDDLLRIHERATLPGRSYPNGAHFAEVEVDPETGEAFVVKYAVVDDFGNLINPMIVQGQIHGGVVQGIGQAMREHVVHDADGQLLSASFMDYAMPRARDMPWIKFVNEPVPSTANVLGMKGCGEAGTVGAMAAVANAMMDALSARGVEKVDMPFTPLRVWQMLNDVKIAAE